MIFLSGKFFSNTKKIINSLTKIYGIGIRTAKKIMKILNLNKNLKFENLNETELLCLNQYIEKSYKIEKKLKQQEYFIIKNLKNIKNYRGIRHLKKLPTRGQRTKTNAKTQCLYKQKRKRKKKKFIRPQIYSKKKNKIIDND